MNASTGGQVRNVVLVHGAYADGSSWSEVIARPQAAGLRATAVQNPLVSLADDVAHTRRVLAMQDGPTILAGHSFAGTVITEAGTDPRVVGLEYIAARAPDADEDYAALKKTSGAFGQRAGALITGPPLHGRAPTSAPQTEDQAKLQPAGAH
jgi:pimeloyl-ACP methyl ester carboxylesterase